MCDIKMGVVYYGIFDYSEYHVTNHVIIYLRNLRNNQPRTL